MKLIKGYCRNRRSEHYSKTRADVIPGGWKDSCEDSCINCNWFAELKE